METAVKLSDRKHRRGRKKKKQKGLKLLNRADQSPSRNLGLQKNTIRKDRSAKIQQITKQCLQSVIHGLYSGQILFENCKTQNNLADHTIDLCDADDSMTRDNSSILVVSPIAVQPKEEIVIDLSKDLPGHDEVIDLTETTRVPPKDCGEAGSLEPAVIDITEEETNENQSGKLESDEVSIIGTFSKSSATTNACRTHPSFSPLSNKNTRNNVNNLISCSEKLKRKYLKKRSILDRIDCRNFGQYRKDFLRSKSPVKVTRIGENVYTDSPVTLPSSGLRPIIIDGSNVAFIHSNINFCCKRLEICINYFKEKGHKVTAFVPQFRLNSHKSDDPQLLRKLEKQGDVVLTPSKKIDGRNIVPYDDRFIVQTAVLKGGIIVSRDNYNDLLRENPAWAETIKYRTLAFTWVDNVLMFPKDPLGEFGPSLEEFLRFH